MHHVPSSKTAPSVVMQPWLALSCHDIARACPPSVTYTSEHHVTHVYTTRLATKYASKPSRLQQQYKTVTAAC